MKVWACAVKSVAYLEPCTSERMDRQLYQHGSVTAKAPDWEDEGKETE